MAAKAAGAEIVAAGVAAAVEVVAVASAADASDENATIGKGSCYPSMVSKKSLLKQLFCLEANGLRVPELSRSDSFVEPEHLVEMGG